MATYIALTTTNPRAGWEVVDIGADGDDKSVIEQRALTMLTGGAPVEDINTETRVRNLVVVSRSQCQRNRAWRTALDRCMDRSFDEPSGDEDCVQFRYLG